VGIQPQGNIIVFLSKVASYGNLHFSFGLGPPKKSYIFFVPEPQFLISEKVGGF
jgi:hypothetical protein